MNIDHLRRLSEILGHKWDLVILAHLAERPLRYTELSSRVREIDSDLTEGVLNKNLKRLAADGLIQRERTNGHHVWNLTRRGRYIVATLAKIRDFDDEAPPDGPEPDDN
ncbi:winged helix-turn-helix transcriptional regulator [Micromonospora sp. CPCC 206061]|uniref:winged helix-turn-helix transcriptional regulator n=1 Tax=Micromonospora sp. CPCC 206061 TaxID=3122410 RepID=UPI002FF10D57